jgi:hypothetical protein
MPVPIIKKDLEEQGKNEADLLKIKNQPLTAH